MSLEQLPEGAPEAISNLADFCEDFVIKYKAQHASEFREKYYILCLASDLAERSIIYRLIRASENYNQFKSNFKDRFKYAPDVFDNSASNSPNFIELPWGINENNHEVDCSKVKF